MATKKPAPKSPDALPYVVLSNLDHDGRRFAPGETVHLEADEAEPLLAIGVVKAAE